LRKYLSKSFGFAVDGALFQELVCGHDDFNRYVLLLIVSPYGAFGR
jgi:hypothetical protein